MLNDDVLPTAPLMFNGDHKSSSAETLQYS